MSTNPLVTFLGEIFSRIFSKSPLFFKVWTWASSLVVAVSGLPALLTYLNVTLPPALTIFENKTLGIAASVALFMSLMPVQSPVISVNKATGVTTKATDESSLPFTTAHETKIADVGNTPVK